MKQDCGKDAGSSNITNNNNDNSTGCLTLCLSFFCRGLEDQLLASVVGAEQPDLEKTKNDLVQVSVTIFPTAKLIPPYYE